MLNNKSKLQIINTDKGIAEWLNITDLQLVVTILEIA